MASLPERLSQYIAREGGRALADYLLRQRWFGAKGRQVSQVRLLDYAALPHVSRSLVLAIVSVEFHDGPTTSYFLPLVVGSPKETEQLCGADLVFRLPNGPEQAAVFDATADPIAGFALLGGIRAGHEWRGQQGLFRCRPTIAADSALTGRVQHATRLSGEQSNTSIVFDRQLILKVIRHVSPGINPDREILDFLTTRARYQSVPPLIGSIDYCGSLDPESSAESFATVGLLQAFIPNEGDGWTMALQHVRGLLDESRTPEAPGHTASDGPTLVQRVQRIAERDIPAMAALGTITAELHNALASEPYDPAFRPEPISETDLSEWQSHMRSQLHTVLGQLRTLGRTRLTELQLTAEALGELESLAERQLDTLRLLLDDPVTKIRVHGDYHLGQVLKTGHRFVILDFEGEPARRLEQRRAKHCALKDVAGMLRSFNYAHHAVLRDRKTGSLEDERATDTWERVVREAFWTGYTRIAKPGDASFLPLTHANAEQILRVFELDKTIYEIGYELNNRPDWVSIPLRGLHRILRGS